MNFFILLHIKKVIMKNVGNQIVLVTIDLHCMDQKKGGVPSAELCPLEE